VAAPASRAHFAPPAARRPTASALEPDPDLKLLFVHPNLPGQYKSIAPGLAAAGFDVTAIGRHPIAAPSLPGVTVHRYKGSPFRVDPRFPPLDAFANQIRQGRAAAALMTTLRDRGYEPDVVVGHPGWGDLMFLRQVWPAARLISYLEFYYKDQGADYGFDPEFPVVDQDRQLLTLRNLAQIHAQHHSDLCISPTRWQRDLFPAPVRRSIHVLHEGVDTRALKPRHKVRLRLPDGRLLTRATPVLTYSARNLEPYRGFHVFMRALPEIQRDHPKLFTVIVGGDGVSYGRRPPNGGNWREAMLAEVGDRLDLDRIWFAGKLPYADYQRVLQLSTVHTYLTFPFVLSWSFIEAMACGCTIVGSRTGPVEEVLEDGVNGRLVPFFDREALRGTIGELLADEAQRQRLGLAARAHARRHYDVNDVTLPHYAEAIRAVAEGRRISRRPPPLRTTPALELAAEVD
jgi:glycosyltransferase involved in cell wall biosynthesis